MAEWAFHKLHLAISNKMACDFAFHWSLAKYYQHTKSPDSAPVRFTQTIIFKKKIHSRLILHPSDITAHCDCWSAEYEWKQKPCDRIATSFPTWVPLHTHSSGGNRRSLTLLSAGRVTVCCHSLPLDPSGFRQWLTGAPPRTHWVQSLIYSLCTHKHHNNLLGFSYIRVTCVSMFLFVCLRELMFAALRESNVPQCDKSLGSLNLRRHFFRSPHYRPQFY